jgi:catalase
MQAGMKGFVSFPQPVEADKVRGKPEKFAEHYNQARLFYDSQSPGEQAHIAAAFRFELSKLTVPAIRERMLAGLRNASEPLAKKVADGLGIALPEAMPRALARAPRPEVARSPALSLLARPGDASIRTRRVAILVTEGSDEAGVAAVRKRLLADGAVVRLVGQRVGPVQAAGGGVLDADASLENEPSFLFDGIVLADGAAAIERLLLDGRTMEFIKDPYRHCKAILALGEARQLLEAARIPETLPDGGEDKALVRADTAAAGLDDFIEALCSPRDFARETDPPRV